MEFVCMRAPGWGGILTKGKVYNTLDITRNSIFIMGDDGYKYLVDSDKFLPLTEYRVKKIKSILK